MTKKEISMAAKPRQPQDTLPISAKVEAAKAVPAGAVAQDPRRQVERTIEVIANLRAAIVVHPTACDSVAVRSALDASRIHLADCRAWLERHAE